MPTLQEKANTAVADYNVCLAKAGDKATTTTTLNAAEIDYDNALAAFANNQSNANAQLVAQAIVARNAAETADTNASAALAAAVTTLTNDKQTLMAAFAPFA